VLNMVTICCSSDRWRSAPLAASAASREPPLAISPLAVECPYDCLWAARRSTLYIVGPWQLEWDGANVEHLERHGISPEEVEEVFEGRIVRRRGGTDAPDRFRVLGRTASGRYLTLVCQQKPGGIVRPFTGWDMRPHERALYGRQAGS
jgi:uncharacterized DUF497 family protein